ncbi:unnamed protein product [Arabidopsis lyrata]|uniref:GBF-interacting protein 1 N-terminal domain-containing protein n=1 Tax=Arabidopsis lyrata subsp. lyrata TaxID=81972 RepID=D7L1B7_ARALL|nr:GBF-interacting protein 1 [Arabidopsis lyrata subsp. lyrata]EFH61213.1 hypothetical protein ARALYDRAFT_478702 [Arabidopsis lyrata subsp. lyrata]CAH8260301.1 unnamed protein product [Arabidopsis lyrata]|eukprot:XP_002884954.1 GBF-interacting protein 1 [Arabidopsis lyrata subsp. lyrata]
MSSSSCDGGSRVSIPADLLETIQNIREVTGKQHSDEDIFSVFKECFNDPHETTQKLLFLDTFHEVRSKRERKKENLVPNTQGRGRTGRRNFASSYTDASNGRTAAFKKQSGANHIIGGSGTASSAPNNARNDTKPSSIMAPNPINLPSGISNHKLQDAIISPVNKGVTEEQPLPKSTSLSEDVVEPDKSKASTVPVAVSDSVVENDVYGTSQIPQPSERVIKSEVAANKGKNQSLLKSDVGEQPHVTFPVHLQVAKMLENGLTFGSFDSNFVREASSDNCTIGCDDSNSESSHGTAAYGASVRKDVSTFSQDKNHEISNSAAQKELTLQPDQTVLSVDGSEGDKVKDEFLPITDTHQAAKCDAPLISYPDQYSIAAAQQAMHLRQQYSLNFFPYGPYFPPYYMPQPYIHQYLSPNGFQQQSYLPPRDDASAPPGAELPLTHIKPGSEIGNSPPTTIPFPYALYAFNHIPSAATVNTTHKEEKKENIYTTGPLSLANLQASPMYNFSLQGHPIAFPTIQPGIPGIYQQTQPVLAPPTISTRTEPIGPSHITNQQPQAALTNLGNNY